MTKWAESSVLALMLAGTGLSATAGNLSAASQTNLISIQVSVDGKAIQANSDEKISLGTLPRNIDFYFGPAPNSKYVPIRLRDRLDGYDKTWNQVTAEMNLTVRFYNDAGDQVDQRIFTVTGDSGGWDGSLKTSPLTHRREAIIVPKQASRLWIVISSAGAPAAVGIYVVDNLQVSLVVSNGAPKILMQPPLDSALGNFSDARPPDGWIRDGLHPSMAKIVEVGQDPATKAFAILDDDPFSHAEWHNIMAIAPAVKPGQHLIVEWNEMYSIGSGDTGAAYYNSLPPGNYHFQVQETTIMGSPTGVAESLGVLVPEPFWKNPWFLGSGFLAAILISTAGARYVIWRRMRQEVLRLENQHALEQERLRIAHDIHDDLGARVTQISLLSAMARGYQSLPEKARVDFDQISSMSRELISALYETVWAVNPENDNLDALGNYLCQMANQMCEQAQLGCRLQFQDLPKDVQLPSQMRHNITMAVKESLHNVIKHAGATEVVLRATFDSELLEISIHDNGRGFQSDRQFPGHGLKNIKRRLEDIGGSCLIESRPDQGTTVHLRLFIHPSV